MPRVCHTSRVMGHARRRCERGVAPHRRQAVAENHVGGVAGAVTHPAAKRFGEIVATTLNESAPAPMPVATNDTARPWNVVFARHTAGTGQ